MLPEPEVILCMGFGIWQDCLSLSLKIGCIFMLATTKSSGWFHFMAAVTVSIWGTTFVSTKILIGYGLSPVDILFYRFLLAYICIFFFSYQKLLSNSWRDELMFVAVGLCGGSLYFVAENTAVGITLASNVSLIICTAPIMAAFHNL